MTLLSQNCHMGMIQLNLKPNKQPNPLRSGNEPIDIDDLYGQAKVCLACHNYFPKEGCPHLSSHTDILFATTFASSLTNAV